ncbi:MAG: NADPH-dependent FMN reductase [Chthoniobacterales bacterium]
MSLLVISSSLNPNSRSRIMAKEACEFAKPLEHQLEILDLKHLGLPPCDGGPSYSHENTVRAATMVSRADAILLSTPIYNYSLNAAAKNLIELTGQHWKNKVVGFLCAAGGDSSYMSIMGIAGSLMLDFRCIIIPRFVYASGAAFADGALVDEELRSRIHELVQETLRISRALKN